jgi:hypothetical protein
MAPTLCDKTRTLPILNSLPSGRKRSQQKRGDGFITQSPDEFTQRSKIIIEHCRYNYTSQIYASEEIASMASNSQRRI